MNKYIKNSSTISLIFIFNLITAMEYPQLQLETPKKQLVKHVPCSITIPNNAGQLVAYGMKTVHDAIFEHSKVQSTIKDPIICLHIQSKQDRKEFYVPLPAKLLINCTDGSILHLHETDGSKFFNSHPIFKKIPLKITATCMKNPKLEGDSFAEQFNNAMNEFYEDPGTPWDDEEHEDELETAKVITKRAIIHTSQIVLSPYGPILTQARYIIFNHGPNGCPDEKTFIQSIIDDKIPQNMSCFRSLKNRELTSSFGK